MLYYPQLTTGAVSQFPVARVTNMRTVANQLASGYTIRMEDTGAQKVQWQLRYSSLTDVERSSIESLFEASEGQLNTFTFLDPTDNLLMWSEDWTQAVWTADPLLQVTGGVSDPMGGSDAMQLTNTAQTTQQIVQGTSGPSSFLYCFSVFVRSAAPATIQLVLAATRTGLSDARYHRFFVAAREHVRHPLGRTDRHLVRGAIAGRRTSGRLRRAGGSTARSRIV